MAIRISEYSLNNRRPSIVSEPELIGYFSIDEDGNFLPTLSRLFYYNPPDGEEVHLDLNQGIESGRICRANTFHEHDLLWKWLSLNRSKLQVPTETKEWIKPNFMCTRGVLLNLLCTPFLPNAGWIIHAAKWDGTIHMRIEEMKRAFQMSEDQKKFEYWGFKYEQYIISHSPHEAPDTSKPVSEARGGRGVYQRRIGDHTVVYSAVMKGVCSETPLSDPLSLRDLKFMETRTNRIIKDYGGERNFRRYKLLKWWAQGFLTNTDELLCGFRDDSGIVRQLKRYRLDEMVRMGETYWNPTSCTNFCDMFLTKVSETVVDNYQETIYKFEKNPHEDGIKIVKLTSTPQNTVILTQLFAEMG